jgi:hypothetical protein
MDDQAILAPTIAPPASAAPSMVWLVIASMTILPKLEEIYILRPSR